MEHTLALEELLTKKYNDQTLLPNLIEEFLRRGVLENVLSVFDSKLIPRFLNLISL